MLPFTHIAPSQMHSFSRLLSLSCRRNSSGFYYHTASIVDLEYFTRICARIPQLPVYREKTQISSISAVCNLKMEAFSDEVLCPPHREVN